MKSQSSSEFLIIVAMVLIILTIFTVTIGKFPAIATSNREQVLYDQYLKYDISLFAHTNESITNINLKNNKNVPILITEIIIDDIVLESFILLKTGRSESISINKSFRKIETIKIKHYDYDSNTFFTLNYINVWPKLSQDEIVHHDDLIYGAVGYWSFDKILSIEEDYSIPDIIGTNNGEIKENFTQSKGWFKHGLVLREGNYIELNTPLNSPESWTYSFWFNPTSNLESNTGLIGQNNLSMITLNAIPQINITTKSSSSNQLVHGPNSSNLSYGNWYHVVVTFVNTTTNPVVEIYINGFLNATKSDYMEAIKSPNGIHTIGKNDEILAYEGLIDEVIIFNRDLSQKEIKKLYDAYN